MCVSYEEQDTCVCHMRPAKGTRIKEHFLWLGRVKYTRALTFGHLKVLATNLVANDKSDSPQSAGVQYLYVRVCLCVTRLSMARHTVCRYVIIMHACTYVRIYIHVH